MCECDELEEIKNLVIEIKNLSSKEYKLRHSNKYKCENYDTFNIDYYETKLELNSKRMILLDKCNDFVNYPTKKFLCFNLTKKIKFKNKEFIGLLMEIPFIDKQEYFCLINLFENMNNYLVKWYPIMNFNRHETISFMFR